MDIVKTVSALILTAVILYYLFSPNSASTISALASGTTGFTNALMGKG